jgi:hypothetical protein
MFVIVLVLANIDCHGGKYRLTNQEVTYHWLLVLVVAPLWAGEVTPAQHKFNPS